MDGLIQHGYADMKLAYERLNELDDQVKLVDASARAFRRNMTVRMSSTYPK